MTIQDLINEIKLLYPNTFADADIITFINRIKIPKNILDQICKRNILSFPSVIDKAIYSETAGLDFQLIEKVTVDGKELKPVPGKDTDESFNGGYWYVKFLNDYLFINPKPTVDDLDIQVDYYINRPKYSLVTDTIDLTDDYIELLKYGVLILLCKANDDVDKSNGFIADYDYLIEQFKADESVSNDTSNTITDVYGW